MQITTLPKDLNINTSFNLQLYDYRSQENILKTKINLSKHTISFLRTGTKEVIGQGEAKQIDRKKFLIIKSGNCLMTERVSDANKYYRSILLFFDDEMVLAFLEKYQLTDNLRYIDKKSFYVFQYDNFIQHFVVSLERMLLFSKPIQQPLLKVKFEEIMLYLTYQYGTEFLNEIVQKVDDRMSRLTNIVESNKYNRLSLEEIAFLSNMSVSTFKRNFFKQYQTTPIKWFNEQRLNHVATLLRTQQKRPIDVYEEAGYDNFSNFIQAFKKKFSVTPKQYQEQF